MLQLCVRGISLCVGSAGGESHPALALRKVNHSVLALRESKRILHMLCVRGISFCVGYE